MGKIPLQARARVVHTRHNIRFVRIRWIGRRTFETLLKWKHHNEIGKITDWGTMLELSSQSWWPTPSFCHVYSTQIKFQNKIKLLHTMQAKIYLPSLERQEMFCFQLIWVIVFWLPVYFQFVGVAIWQYMSHQQIKNSSQHRSFNDSSWNVSILQLHCSYNVV